MSTDKLSEIAKRAGVSPNTVLRVLRGENKEIWPSAISRAEQIRSLARKMAYMPNSSARAMRRGRFNCVALLLSADQGKSYLPDELFNGIHDALAAAGLRLVISKLPDAELTSEEVLPSILREWSCDGLLINYTDRVPPKMGELIQRYKLPAIWINRRQSADCVFYDDMGGATALTRHLIELGHRRITYVDFVAADGPDLAHYSRRDRYEGYARAMEEAGLAATPRSHFAGIPVIQRLDAERKLLEAADRPTAVITYDAGDRLLYAAGLAGVRVPEDVSLVSFGTRHAPPPSEVKGEMYIGRSVGVARLPTETAGRRAVEMLIEKIENPDVSLEPEIIPLELEPGDTCGVAPNANQLPSRRGQL